MVGIVLTKARTLRGYAKMFHKSIINEKATRKVKTQVSNDSAMDGLAHFFAIFVSDNCN